MARTHKKVGYSPTGKLEDVTPDMAARGIEEAFRMLEGRWKMVIIFHLTTCLRRVRAGKSLTEHIESVSARKSRLEADMTNTQRRLSNDV